MRVTTKANMAKCDPKSKITFNNFYKTKLCPWFKKGVCRWGEHCNYAHSEEEQRGAVDLTKTTLCPHLEKDDGHCSNPQCRYAHTHEELRATTDVYKTSMCSYFLRDHYCPMGEKCRYAHGPQELRAKPSIEANVFLNHPYYTYMEKAQAKSCSVQQKNGANHSSHATRRSVSLQSSIPSASRYRVIPKPLHNGFTNGNSDITVMPERSVEWNDHTVDSERDGESEAFSYKNATAENMNIPHLLNVGSNKMANIYWGMNLNASLNQTSIEKVAGGNATNGTTTTDGDLPYFVSFADFRNDNKSDGSAASFSNNECNHQSKNSDFSKDNKCFQRLSSFFHDPLNQTSPLPSSLYMETNGLMPIGGTDFRTPLVGAYGCSAPFGLAFGSSEVDNLTSSLSYFKHNELFSCSYPETGIEAVNGPSPLSDRMASLEDIYNPCSREEILLLDLCNDNTVMPDFISDKAVIGRQQPHSDGMLENFSKPSVPLDNCDSDYHSSLSPGLLSASQTWTNTPPREVPNDSSHRSGNNMATNKEATMELPFQALVNASNDSRELGEEKIICSDKMTSAAFSGSRRLSNEMGSRTNLCLMDNTSTTITTSSDHDSQLTAQTINGLPPVLLHEFLTTEDTQTSYNSTCTSPKNGKHAPNMSVKATEGIQQNATGVETQGSFVQTMGGTAPLLGSKNVLLDGAIDSEAAWTVTSAIPYAGFQNDLVNGYEDRHFDMLVSLIHGEEGSRNLPATNVALIEEMHESFQPIPSFMSVNPTNGTVTNDHTMNSENSEDYHITDGSHVHFASQINAANKCGPSILNFYSSGFNGCTEDSQIAMEQKMVLLESEKHSLQQENDKLRECLKKLIGI